MPYSKQPTITEIKLTLSDKLANVRVVHFTKMAADLDENAAAVGGQNQNLFAGIMSIKFYKGLR